ncbi:hypothetical protein [Leyella stercorea]|uniref:hypothetical protein n=1 Tax=Leyella stercorea TaxID=363265 RepID=UPI0024313D96|nr:hypothetical protein [Leyella stercorea]
MKNKSSISGLLAAAQSAGHDIQNVKSVANAPEQAGTPASAPAAQPTEQPQPKEVKPQAPETVKASADTDFASSILKKRDDKDVEIVRIPRSMHKELKVLSSMTGVPIGHLVANFIEASMKQHEKDLTALKKKYIKEL